MWCVGEGGYVFVLVYCLCQYVQGYTLPPIPSLDVCIAPCDPNVLAAVHASQPQDWPARLPSLA